MVSRRTLAHTNNLLSIVVDGRSREIVGTDPIPKPGVSSTLPLKKREMLYMSSRTWGPPHIWHRR